MLRGGAERNAAPLDRSGRRARESPHPRRQGSPRSVRLVEGRDDGGEVIRGVVVARARRRCRFFDRIAGSMPLVGVVRGRPGASEIDPTLVSQLRRLVAFTSRSTSRRQRPRRSASGSARCWSGRSRWTCGTTTLRSDPAGARPAERHRDAPAGAAAQGRSGGHQDRAGVEVRTACRQAGVRVRRADRGRDPPKCSCRRGTKWTWPAAFGPSRALRMKAKREHRVPLCGRAAGGPRRGAGARRRASRSCSQYGVGGRSRRRRCRRCSSTTRSPPWLMGSGRRSGTGRRRRPITRRRSSRRRSLSSSRIRWRPPTPGRNCSSGDGG